MPTPKPRIETPNLQLWCCDCFNALKELPDNSIDLVLTDPPYGTTACAWDSVLDLGRLWPAPIRAAR